MPLLEAAITGGAALLGQGFNAAAQGKMNRKTREFSEEMYGRNKQDNLDFWNMQNDYNSPQNQMARLKAAGLNPNMVYGNGSAVQTAGPIKEVNTPTWSPNAPRVNLEGAAGSMVNTYFDTEIKKAQVDNLRTQNTAIATDTMLKAANTAATLQGITHKDGLFPYTMEQLKESVRKLSADANISHNDSLWRDSKNENEQAINVQRLNNLESDLKIKLGVMKGQSLDQKLKSLDIELQKNGIQKSDPIYMRILGRILGGQYSLKDLQQ